MKRAGIFAALIFTAALVFSGCPSEPSEPPPEKTGSGDMVPKAGPIRIGALFASTGPANSLGLPEKQTVEMLVEKINARGGVLGRKLELIIYDTEGDENKAVALAGRLVSDKVSAIIGPTRSGPSLAIIKTINGAMIPNVSCAASYKIVTDENGSARHWIFKTTQSDSMAVERIYEYFNRHDITRIAVMAVSNGYGDSGRGELLRLAPNYGIEIAADERFGQDDEDMTAKLTRIKDTGAQAIVVWAVQNAPAVVAREVKNLGLPQLVVQSHGVAAKKFIELCGEAADGQVLPASRLIVVDQLPDSDPHKAALKEYRDEFEARFGPVSAFGGYAYDALMLTVMAIEKAGSDDPARIRDALEEIKGFVGATGIFTMSAADHNGLTKDAFVMVKIENMDWKHIAE